MAMRLLHFIEKLMTQLMSNNILNL